MTPQNRLDRWFTVFLVAALLFLLLVVYGLVSPSEFGRWF